MIFWKIIFSAKKKLSKNIGFFARKFFGAKIFLVDFSDFFVTKKKIRNFRPREKIFFVGVEKNFVVQLRCRIVWTFDLWGFQSDWSTLNFWPKMTTKSLKCDHPAPTLSSRLSSDTVPFVSDIFVRIWHQLKKAPLANSETNRSFLS